jgi:lipoate-protein ligase A
MAWAVERLRAHPADLHARALPEPVRREVWLCEPTAPALVLGSAQADDVVDRAACEAAGVAVVRRRSGGGAVLVAPGRQLWVDVVLPADDPLWSPDVGRAFLWLGEAWATALAAVGVPGEVHRGGLVPSPWSDLVCFAGRGTGEVLGPDGAKLVGLSQRRTRAGARFQGSALGGWEPEELLGLLALDPARRAAGAAELATVAGGVGVDLGALEGALLDALP